MEPHPILLFTIFTIPLAFLTAIVNVYAPRPRESQWSKS